MGELIQALVGNFGGWGCRWNRLLWSGVRGVQDEGTSRSDGLGLSAVHDVRGQKAQPGMTMLLLPEVVEALQNAAIEVELVPLQAWRVSTRLDPAEPTDTLHL